MIGQETAVISGIVKDQNNKAIEAVNISLNKTSNGTISAEDGFYSLQIPADESVILNITHISFKPQQFKIKLKAGEKRQLNFKLVSSAYNIEEIEVKEERNRDNTMESLDPKNIQFIPTPNGSFEAVIKTLPGVYSNNELTSQYNVRGGSFDENLVYVNDVEIYRPFLIRSGNQEGLSFINPDLVDNIDFSAGGFEARYGDKMSSVLSVTYKEPEEFAGSINGSLQGGSLHIEGSPGNHRFTYLTGMRYRSNQYVLNSLDTDGDYQPVFMDFQTCLLYTSPSPRD